MAADIRSFFAFIVGALQILFDTLNSVDVAYGSTLFVGLGDVLICGCIVTVILSVLWKGAKS